MTRRCRRSKPSARTRKTSASGLTVACAAFEQALGQREQAARRLDGAIAGAEAESGERVALLIAKVMDQFFQREFEEMVEWGERAVEASREVDDVPLAAAAMGALVMAYALTAQLEQAEQMRAQVVPIIESMSDEALAIRLDAMGTLTAARDVHGPVQRRGRALGPRPAGGSRDRARRLRPHPGARPRDLCLGPGRGGPRRGHSRGCGRGREDRPQRPGPGVGPAQPVSRAGGAGRPGPGCAERVGGVRAGAFARRQRDQQLGGLGPRRSSARGRERRGGSEHVRGLDGRQRGGADPGWLAGARRDGGDPGGDRRRRSRGGHRRAGIGDGNRGADRAADGSVLGEPRTGRAAARARGRPRRPAPRR